VGLQITIETRMPLYELPTGDDISGTPVVIHGGFDTSTGLLTGSTTPDVTAAAYETVTLSGGAATVDLTALTLNGDAVSLSGLKPRAIRFKNTGANNMTIAKGASNGYDGLGGSFSVTLEPGQAVMFDLGSAGNAVGGTNKTLDVSGTGTDTLQLSAVAGT
jgi:hypothetical protein